MRCWRWRCQARWSSPAEKALDPLQKPPLIRGFELLGEHVLTNVIPKHQQSLSTYLTVAWLRSAGKGTRQSTSGTRLPLQRKASLCSPPAAEISRLLNPCPPPHHSTQHSVSKVAAKAGKGCLNNLFVDQPDNDRPVAVEQNHPVDTLRRGQGWVWFEEISPHFVRTDLSRRRGNDWTFRPRKKGPSRAPLPPPSHSPLLSLLPKQEPKRENQDNQTR